MTYGVKSKSTLPPGRRSFTDAPSAPQIARPGASSDGQPRDGTPAGRESTTAGSSTYSSKASQAYRAGLRGDTDVGLAGSKRESVGPNPQVGSKATRKYGIDGSKLPGATNASTGTQPVLAADRSAKLPGALPARDRQAGKMTSEHVGYRADGSFKEQTHPNTGKHFQGAAVLTRSPGLSKLDQAGYLSPTKRGPSTK